MPASDTDNAADRSSSSSPSDSNDRASEAQDSLSDKSRDALSGSDSSDTANEPSTTPEDRAAAQDRMAAEGRTSKDRVERDMAQDTTATEDDTQTQAQKEQMTYADALDQEVAALNAVAAGQSARSANSTVEANPAPLGFEIDPEATVTQAAYEIAPSGNMFGRDYGVVTAGRDGFATELDAVESFRDVVDWYRSGDGAKEYELGTTIYEAADGTFGHNEVVTFYSDTSVSPFLDVPEGARVVGIAHSHPEPGFVNGLFGYDGENFSGTDIRAQAEMERRFGDGFSLYMVSPTNQLNVHPPEQ